MSQGQRQPFIDARAYNKASSTYVTFSSQADAMLASLQLFHDLPCRTMDLFFSVITHPNFDARQLTLRNSVDVINVVEQSRLRDRAAVVRNRALNSDGYVEQAGFPQFVLDEVLDIIHADRMVNIEARLEENLEDRQMCRARINIAEDNILKSLALVHRTWTLPAQKALGRVLHIGRPTREMDVLLSPIQKSIFGPWTSVVAVHLFCPINASTDSDTSWTEYERDDNARETYRQWFETMHRILVSFIHLKCIYVKSYASFLTEWANVTIRDMFRQNTRLEEVILYAHKAHVSIHPFNLDCLIENHWTTRNLRSLKIEGAVFSDDVLENRLEEVQFTHLRELTIRSYNNSWASDDLVLLPFLSANLNSGFELKLDGTADDADGYLRRCGASFHGVHALYVSSSNTKELMEMMIPHCSNLKNLTVAVNVYLSPDLLNVIPSTIQGLDIRIRDTIWDGPFCDETERWKSSLWKLLSFGHLSELKWFRISLSENDTHGYYVPDKRDICKAHKGVQEFDKETKDICVVAGVDYSLQILSEEHIEFLCTLRCIF